MTWQPFIRISSFAQIFCGKASPWTTYGRSEVSWCLSNTTLPGLNAIFLSCLVLIQMSVFSRTLASFLQLRDTKSRDTHGRFEASTGLCISMTCSFSRRLLYCFMNASVSLLGFISAGCAARVLKSKLRITCTMPMLQIAPLSICRIMLSLGICLF